MPLSSAVEYPSSLPLPMVDGFSRRLTPGFYRDDPSSAPGLTQFPTFRLSDDLYTTYSMKMIMTDAQAAEFEDFISINGLLYGAPFKIKLPSEYGEIEQTVRFISGGEPSVNSYNRGHVEYSATVLARYTIRPQEAYDGSDGTARPGEPLPDPVIPEYEDSESIELTIGVTGAVITP